MTVTEFLHKHVPLLMGLTLEEARALALTVEQRVYCNEESALLKGATAEGLYVVATGKVAVWARPPNDRFLIEVAQLGPGEVFGETSILEGGVAGATVKAAENDTLIFIIPERAFRYVLARNREVAMRAAGLIARRKKKTITLTAAEFLQTQVPLLAGLTKEQAEELALTTEYKRYQLGQSMLLQATTSEGLYVVADGKVGVWTSPPRDKNLLKVAELGPGEVFGEISIIETGFAVATVKALEEDTFIFLIPADSFQALLATNPEIAYRVSEMISRRMRMNEALLAARQTPVAAAA